MKRIFLVILCIVLIGCGGGGGGGQIGGTTPGGTTMFQMGGAIQGKALSLSNTVTTIAGFNPGADGTGPAASFSNPHGITTDGTNLYVTDTGNGTIRKITISTGVVTTLAGTAGLVGSGSTDGTGSAARFNGPTGITTDGANLYVTDFYYYSLPHPAPGFPLPIRGHTIRKIVISSGVVTTIAGTDGVTGSTDGTGSAASFAGPAGIASDGTNLYVADTGNYSIRKIQ